MASRNAGGDPVAKRVRRLWSSGAAAAAAGPLALWAAAVEPPWPDRPSTITGIATLFCVLAAIIARVVELRRPVLRRAGVALLAGGAVLCVLYLIFFSLSVYTATQRVNGTDVLRRWVIGTELQPQFRDLNVPIGELLARGGYQPENIWTKESVTRARIALLTAYLTAFACIVAGLTLIARQQRD
jgi:hypothetical protein